MRSGLLISALICASVLVPPTLDGQQIRSPYRYIERDHSVGVFAGYVGMQDANPPIGPHSAPLVGLRYNLRLSGPLSAEASFTLIPTERDVLTYNTEAGTALPIGETVPMNVFLAGGGLIFHITGNRTWNGIAPFVGLGGGLASNLARRTAAEVDVPQNQLVDFGPGFAVDMQAGTDVFLTERLSLRFQARNQLLRIQAPAGLLGTQRPETQWTNNLGFSVGTAMHF